MVNRSCAAVLLEWIKSFPSSVSNVISGYEGKRVTVIISHHESDILYHKIIIKNRSVLPLRVYFKCVRAFSDTSKILRSKISVPTNNTQPPV